MNLYGTGRRVGQKAFLAACSCENTNSSAKDSLE